VVVETFTGKPYEDQLNLFDKKFVRTFFDVESEELIWHRDAKNRTVKVLKSDGWKFQMDNELPFEMKSGHLLEIEKETYHRLHKGVGELIIEIEEHD
jgi:hypothetical protein